MINQSLQLAEPIYRSSPNNTQNVKKMAVLRDICEKPQIQNFTVFFQPQYCLTRNKYIGAESLTRIKTSSNNFFPFKEVKKIENSNSYHDFGLHVIYESLVNIKPVLTHHPEFKVSINVAPEQLHNPEFIDNFYMIVNHLDFPYENICIEIVESSKLIITNGILNIIKTLKSAGVTFAADDFGTGFSSLELISEVDFDIIKIDKFFIDKIEKEKKARSLLTSMLSVCESVNADIIVEGVENPNQLGILSTIKSNLILQGYFYAKPMHIDNLNLILGR